MGAARAKVPGVGTRWGAVGGAGVRRFRKAGAAGGDRAGSGGAGEVSRVPGPHPSELMG